MEGIPGEKEGKVAAEAVEKMEETPIAKEKEPTPPTTDTFEEVASAAPETKAPLSLTERLKIDLSADNAFELMCKKDDKGLFPLTRELPQELDTHLANFIKALSEEQLLKLAELKCPDTGSNCFIFMARHENAMKAMVEALVPDNLDALMTICKQVNFKRETWMHCALLYNTYGAIIQIIAACSEADRMEDLFTLAQLIAIPDSIDHDS